MVFRNTPANQQLAKRMERVVNDHPGFKAIVDRSWNCGEDIHFEIGTSYALHCPFVIKTSCTDAGHFEISVRMYKDELDRTELAEMKNWASDLESIAEKLTNYIADAKPQRSKYAI